MKGKCQWSLSLLLVLLLLGSWFAGLYSLLGTPGHFRPALLTFLPLLGALLLMGFHLVRCRRLERERQRRHQELDAVLRRNDQLTALVHSVVWELATDWRFTYISPSVTEVLGYRPEEVVGIRHFYDLCPEADRRELMAKAEDVAAQRLTLRSYPHRGVTKDGRTIQMVSSVMPVVDENGTLKGFSGVGTDVTDQWQMEERYQMLFREMLDGFALHDMIFDANGTPVDYRFLAVNPAFERMTGVTAEKVIGRTVLDVFPSTETHWIRTYGKVAETGEPVTFENYAQAMDKYFEVTAFRPEPGQFACIFADVTARRRAEEQLRDTSEYLGKLLDYANAPIIVWDPQYCITRFNRAFERLTGYAADEVLGGPLNRLFPEDTRAASMSLISDATEGRHWETVELLICRRDGGVRTVLWNSATVLAADGKTVTATIAQGQDITERKKALGDRERLQAQIAQMQKMESIGRLAGGVAHDFNNMLQAILGAVEVAMERAEPGGGLHADLQDIVHMARRAASLPRQLLTFARRQPSSPCLTDMNDLVNGMLGMLRRVVGNRVKVAWEPGIGECVVNIDPGQMDQVLTNLFVNARDAIEEEGTITVEVWTVHIDEDRAEADVDLSPGDYVVLVVSDTGSGMDPDTRDRIFEPFFTTKAEGKGTGLGLPTVYGIVKQNGGVIRVYSEPGTGTTFKLYFPRQAVVPVPGSPLPAAVQDPVGGPETVLMVEDEPSISKSTRIMLERLGYRVLVAESPTDALRLSDEEPGDIDLLLTDVMMPGMNGTELARRLCERRPALKYLFMSGYTANMLEDSLAFDSTVDFLQKPFTRSGLAMALRRALAR